jgi:hypothetical protein
MSTFYANYPSVESAGGGSGNPAAGPTGAPVPTDADYIGFSVAGTLTGVSAATPLPVSIDGDIVIANVNVSDFGGNPVVTGTGTSGLGIPRVTVSSDSFPATQPVSGTVTVVQPTGSNLHADIDSSALPTGAATNAELITINTTLGSPFQAGGSIGNTSFIATQTTGANLHVDVDNFPATQPVSGTVAVTQSTSPWVNNISQFGGNPVVTGTGASGVGIPRVTVSNDSNVLATQSGTWTVQPGNTANTTPWLATVNQGGNSAAVKAASTPAAATDPALVVAISPNNTIATSAPINSNATFTGSLSVTTTEGSTAAPANAIGVVFEAESSNATNIRWGVSNSSGSILSTSSGVLMEPGRSIDFLPIGTGTFLHYISTAAGSNVIDIQWILSH